MVANLTGCRAVYRHQGKSIFLFDEGGYMSPFRRSNAFARDMGKTSAKGSGGAGALRQAMARRRLEERREAQILKQQLYDVFSDDGQP